MEFLTKTVKKSVMKCPGTQLALYITAHVESVCSASDTLKNKLVFTHERIL
jgi:hypothetical protein